MWQTRLGGGIDASEPHKTASAENKKMPTDELIALAQRRVAERLLPDSAPSATLGGRSEGAMCAVCAQRIEPGRVEYELEWGPGGVERRLFMHPTCHAAWLVALRSLVTA
jgi:hypothetical protein